MLTTSLRTKPRQGMQNGSCLSGTFINPCEKNRIVEKVTPEQKGKSKKEMQIDRRRRRRRQAEAGVCFNGRQPRRVPWGRGRRDLIGRDGGWFLLLIRGIIKYFDGCALSLRDSVGSVAFHCSEKSDRV